MIDATFLLLCYFIFTTASGRPEDRLTSALGGTTGAGAQDLAPQIIDVQRVGDADVFVLGMRRLEDREALTDALRALPREAGLFVRVHRGPRVASAVAAMQAGHDAGFTQVTYVPAEDGP